MRVVIGADRPFGLDLARPPLSGEADGATVDTCRWVRVSPPAAVVTSGNLAIETTNDAGSGPSWRENSVSCLELVPSGGSVSELLRLADGEGEVGGGPPEGASVTVSSEPTP
jgi:hypothetical protein